MTTTATAQTAPARDIWIDNIKFSILALVVFGHAIERYISVETLHYVFAAIYLFHMPAIIFITGIFARPMHGFSGLMRIMQRSLVIYILAQILCYLSISLVSKNWQIFDLERLFTPYYAMWFMLALFYWLLAISIIPVTYKNIALAVSIILAILVGFIDISNKFALSRAFVFAPFFLTGAFYGHQLISLFRKINFTNGLAILLLCIIAYIEIVPNSMIIELSYARSSYEKITSDSDFGYIYRVVQLILAAMCIPAFMALIPKTASWITLRGQYTLYLYIFHAILLQVARKLDVFPKDFGIEAAGLIALFVALSLYIFSHPRFAAFAKPVIDSPFLDRFSTKK